MNISYICCCCGVVGVGGVWGVGGASVMLPVLYETGFSKLMVVLL